MVQFVASLRFRGSNFKCRYFETCLIFSATHHFLSTIPHPLSLMLDLFITVPSESLQYRWSYNGYIWHFAQCVALVKVRISSKPFPRVLQGTLGWCMPDSGPGLLTVRSTPRIAWITDNLFVLWMWCNGERMDRYEKLSYKRKRNRENGLNMIRQNHMTMSPALRSHHLALIEVHDFFYGKENYS